MNELRMTRESDIFDGAWFSSDAVLSLGVSAEPMESPWPRPPNVGASFCTVVGGALFQFG